MLQLDILKKQTAPLGKDSTMKNTDEDTLVIFGAPDYEEAMARKIAEQAGCMIATATCNWKPVHAGNAYKADGYIVDNTNLCQDGQTVLTPGRIIFFECGDGSIPKNWAEKIKTVRCDHHSPGDPGYDKGPDHYWIGSSLGQLVDWLQMHEEAWYGPNAEKYKMTAAADHCPADAYAGRCPGIDPRDFADFRIRQIAKFELSKLSDEAKGNTTLELMESGIHNEISDATRALKNNPEVNGIVDLRELGVIPQLPEAALKTGRAFMAKIDDLGRDRKPTGNKKVVLQGHTTPRQVKDFMEWAIGLANRIGEPYGNPTRGFAGVVVTD